MQNTQLACPHCGSALNFASEIAAGTPVECLICMRTFAANPISSSVAKVASAASVPKPVASTSVVKSEPKGRPTLPKPAPASPGGRPRRETDEAAQSGRGAMAAILVALLLLVGGGVGVAVWKIIDSNKSGDSSDPDKQIVLNPIKKDDPAIKPGNKSDGNKNDGSKTDGVKPEPQNNNKSPKKVDDDPDDLRTPKKDKDKLEPKKVLERKDPPKTEIKDPDSIPITKIVVPKKVIPGANQPRIDMAIEKGLDYLIKKQLQDGSWGYGGNHPVGFASMCGLTLLECNLPATDKSVKNAVKKAAEYVRAKAASVDKNYEASAAILFLDKLGDAQDKQLIQTLSLRLLAGQAADGGWSYPCATLLPQESQELMTFLQSQKRPGFKPIRPETLSVGLRGLPIVYNQGKAKGKHQLVRSASDNSNTQFALLALWAARRHDVPGDQAFLMAYDRFSQLQHPDGNWSYETNGVPNKSMTCAGLLALAMGHGISPDVVGVDPSDPKKPLIRPAMKDPRIQKGLTALSRYIGSVQDVNAVQSSPMENLYFLWSLERVGVLYDLQDINGKDWFGWGAQMLITRQGPEGAFPSAEYINHEAAANTFFALLFLRRSNLVQDLTETLQLNSGIREP